MEITITLRGTPPSLNKFAGRQNAWDYRAAKQEWTSAVYYSALKYRPTEPFQRAQVHIRYFFPAAARHDADNYAGKFLLDGLTKAGIIIDDDLKHITTTISGDVDRKNPRTEITIKEEK